MRKNEMITFEFDREDLEIMLGFIAGTIHKMEWTQGALKEAADIIRTALQEEDSGDEPVCESCTLPCRHNPNLSHPDTENPDNEDRELLEKIMKISEELENSFSDQNDEKESPNSSGKIEAKEAVNPRMKVSDPIDEAEENEAESLAIELLKAVFSVLTDVIENGE